MLLIPISIKANVMCNDRTYSSSCQSCSRGCCSGHGGCTKNNNSQHNYKPINSYSYTNDDINIANNSGKEQNNIGRKILEIILFLLFFVVPFGSIGLGFVLSIIENIKQKKQN